MFEESPTRFRKNGNYKITPDECRANENYLKIFQILYFELES